MYARAHLAVCLILLSLLLLLLLLFLARRHSHSVSRRSRRHEDWPACSIDGGSAPTLPGYFRRCCRCRCFVYPHPNSRTKTLSVFVFCISLSTASAMATFSRGKQPTAIPRRTAVHEATMSRRPCQDETLCHLGYLCRKGGSDGMLQAASRAPPARRATVLHERTKIIQAWFSLGGSL